MTTELLLLLIVFVYIIMGAFIGDSGIEATFKRAGPRLGARVERHLETGAGFEGAWEAPEKASKRPDEP